jgi:integrase
MLFLTEAKDSTKTVNSFRTLALFPTAKHCLEQVKALQNEYKKLFGKATKAFERPEITLHKLRHTCASLLINKGWDVKKLQYWLGHSDTSTTLNIYSHFDRTRLNEIPADLEVLSESCAGLFQ